MQIVKVHKIHRETVEVSNEAICAAFCPKAGLQIWHIERIPTGGYRFSFGREDRGEVYVGAGTSRDIQVLREAEDARDGSLEDE